MGRNWPRFYRGFPGFNHDYPLDSSARMGQEGCDGPVGVARGASRGPRRSGARPGPTPERSPARSRMRRDRTVSRGVAPRPCVFAPVPRMPAAIEYRPADLNGQSTDGGRERRPVVRMGVLPDHADPSEVNADDDDAARVAALGHCGRRPATATAAAPPRVPRGVGGDGGQYRLAEPARARPRGPAARGGGDPRPGGQDRAQCGRPPGPRLGRRVLRLADRAVVGLPVDRAGPGSRPAL